MVRKTPPIACPFLGIVSSAFADEAPPPRFARDVQPLLKRHCLKCHGPATPEGGLNLSTRGGMVRGGETGRGGGGRAWEGEKPQGARRTEKLPGSLSRWGVCLVRRWSTTRRVSIRSTALT